jgi:GTP cyclohydrolase I
MSAALASHVDAQGAVRALLAHVGEDADRPGLVDTPRRVLDAYSEMTAGYAIDPAALLARTFEQEGQSCYSGIVALRDVPFTSLCEHHLMPFTGYASVAYICPPDAPLVGLSKLARLVDCYALRLQVQERMTAQIVDALVEHLEPDGAACVVRAEHSCLALRGARKAAPMVTSELRGAFFHDAKAREELMALLGGPRG